MTTISQLTDEMALELKRPDLRLFIASAINQTIREVHTGQQGERLRFNSNRVERVITIPEGYPTSYSWPIENYTNFQCSEAYWYESIGRYAKEQKPGTIDLSGRGVVSAKWYWYQSASFICLFGHGGPGMNVLASQFYYPRSLVWHELQANRAAEYNIESQTWTYIDPTLTEEEAQNRTTNWILMRHTDLIREGIRAKVWKRLGDMPRASLAYSAWQDMRAAFKSQETIQESSHYDR